LCNPANKHFALFSNGKKSENPILDPNADPDHDQNLTTYKVGQVLPYLKISAKFARKFLCNRANKQTNGHTNKRRVSHDVLGGGNREQVCVYLQPFSR